MDFGQKTILVSLSLDTRSLISVECMCKYYENPHGRTSTNTRSCEHASERALISIAADSQAHPLSVFKVETIQGAKRR